MFRFAHARPDKFFYDCWRKTILSVVWVNQGLASQREVVRLTGSAIPEGVVAASHFDDREDILALAHISLVEPRRSDDGYLDWALDAAASLRADLLVAARGRGLLASAHDAFARIGVRLACGARDAKVIALCDRKDLFAAAMNEAGIPVPGTRLATDAAALRAGIAAFEGQGGICVKPATGVYGRGFWILDPAIPLMDALMDVHLAGAPRRLPPAILEQAMDRGDAEPVVVMEYLPGTEHSIDCACDVGEVIALAVRRKENSRQIVIADGPEADLGRAVARTLRLDGLVNVQTRADATGRPRVPEVNTRPSGGIGYAAAAGLDLPGTLARRLLGLPAAVRGFRVPAAIRVLDQPMLLERATRSLHAGAEVSAVA